MSNWLIKSEGDCYSIDDLKRDQRTSWTGVRNYQARNFMREMQIGDLCLFYHSSSDPTGVYGVAKVVAKAHSDESQFDKKNDHFEPKATRERPIWQCVDIEFVEKFPAPVSLTEIKRNPKFAGMMVAQRGSRLSIQPVSPTHFSYMLKLGNK